MPKLRPLLPLLCAALFAGHAAWAQEALIRKNLSERLPNLPKIDEVSKSPVPGLYEVRIGQEILYADEQGNHLIQGNLIDTKTRVDLTEARVAKLSAIDFASLPHPGKFINADLRGLGRRTFLRGFSTCAKRPALERTIHRGLWAAMAGPGSGLPDG